MRRKLLAALILAILAASIFLYVFFEMPLVRGIRQKPVGGQATGFVWYVSFDYEGIRYNLVFIPGQKVSVPMPPYEVTTPTFAPMHKVPDDEDFKQFEHFIKEELKIKPYNDKIYTALYEEGTYLCYEYECSLSYQYFGIGYYRERLLYQFFQ